MGHRHCGRPVRRVPGGQIRRRPAHGVWRRHSRRLPGDRVCRQARPRRVLVRVLHGPAGRDAGAAARLHPGHQRDVSDPVREPGADGVAHPAARRCCHCRPGADLFIAANVAAMALSALILVSRARPALGGLLATCLVVTVGVLARGRHRDPARSVGRADAARCDAGGRGAGSAPASVACRAAAHAPASQAAAASGSCRPC